VAEDVAVEKQALKRRAALFKHRMNDVPMSAWYCALEIDLRQKPGKTKVPTPLQAEQGVLY